MLSGASGPGAAAFAVSALDAAANSAGTSLLAAGDLPAALTLQTGAVGAAVSSFGTTLPIAPRAQWDDNNGYCGETSIQTFALRYGTYVSQYRVRAIINPDQKHELLLGENENVALAALRLTYRQWQGGAAPQYQAYLAWTKQQLHLGYPVIGTLYVRGMTYADYDHIVPFIGFMSSHDAANYYADDKLIFYDNYSSTRFTRAFSTLVASRWEANRGSYEYYVPKQTDYGCAVTGIVDPRRETVPVGLSVNRWDEPDVIAGARPATMRGTLTVKSLVPGKTYSLLRYNDYRKVPTGKFLATGGYASARTFIATSTTQTFSDSFLSSAGVTYRCVRADKVVRPIVRTVTPAKGPLAGGTTVTLVGANLSPAIAVRFGTKAAARIVSNSATKIVAVSPAGAGTVDVKVVTAGGTSAVSTATKFTYVAANAVALQSPRNEANGNANVRLLPENLVLADDLLHTLAALDRRRPRHGNGVLAALSGSGQGDLAAGLLG
jgi:hypothetical protein